MKRVLLTLVAVLLILGTLAGAGFAGYRIGYVQGAHTGAGSDAPPFLRDRVFGADEMPGRDLDRGSDRGFIRRFPLHGFEMRARDMRFGFFSPWMFLGRLALLGLIIWLLYRLFKGNGWQLSLTRQPAGEPTSKTEAEFKN